MLSRFQNFIKEHTPFQQGEKILLAVSGGMDSMVLAELCYLSGYSVGVAHVNFGLRAEESVKDESLVQAWAAAHKFDFHVHRPETRNFAQQEGLSTQMAARTLRYQWFQELSYLHGYNWIMTAHHQNDLTETILLNLVHGTGISGLRGMLPVNGNILRPLLFASREELHEFALSSKIAWREDQSNQTDVYQRNFIRNQVIPRLKELNPSLEQTVARNAQRLAETEKILLQSVEESRRHCEAKDGLWYIPAAAHRNSPVILYELLKAKGFQYSAIAQFLEQAHQSGQKLYSSTHVLYWDRDSFILEEKEQGSDTETTISSLCGATEIAGERFEVEVFPVEELKVLIVDKNTILLDADQISLPLSLRKWQQGDKFKPLGMKGYKKVSDLLIDEKLPIPLKNRTLVLCSQGEILWVVGVRTAELHKITAQTRNILRIRRF